MYCSRRLYKGNAYEICLPIADTGITVVRFYTRGDIIIEKEPETTGDSMCFSFTEEDLASLEDGVLRYGYDDFDTNSPYVVVTPGDYSGSTLDDLLEDAYDSGYTAGQADCSGSNCNIQEVKAYNILSSDTRIFRGKAAEANKFFISQNIAPGPLTAITPDAGYDGIGQVNIGITRIEITSVYNSGVTEGFASGYTSGYTAGQEDCSGSTTDADLIANLQGDYYVIPDGTTHLRDYCFERTHFSSITIPDTVISLGDRVFQGLRELKEIAIPDSVTSLGVRCFYSCSGLTSITIGSGLTAIPDYCFYYCESLPSVTIPANVESIGKNAFYDCHSLTAMTFEGLVPPTINTSDSLGSTAYTFPIYVPCQSLEAYKTAFGQYYAPRITCSGSPEPVYSAMPMTFRVISGGTLSWYNGQESFGNDYSYCELKYRVNGGEWGAIANNNSFDPEHIASSITLSSGDYVEFATDRINYSLVDSSSGTHFKFKASSALRYNVEGNIMSILYPIGEFETATSYPESYRSNWFAELFAIENTQEEGGVVDASRLVLPVTALTPACYQDMFYQCVHLVAAPALPATTLASYCYQEMFMGCTSLTSAPELPAPVLTDWCYAQMFSNCPSLNFVKCLATDISVNDCTVDWLKSVPAEGTFEKAPGMTSWPSGDSGIPTGWTVVDAT